MLELRGTRPLLCNNKYNASEGKQVLIYHSTERDTGIEAEQKWLAWHFGMRQRFLPPFSHRLVLQRGSIFVLFYHSSPCLPNSLFHRFGIS